MDLHHDTAQILAAARHDGWSPARKARFLALLADSGNVRLTARRCGFSVQSAYVQRRRDELFAQGWAAALVLARDHAEQVLADRAIEGVEEPIFYRGEQVGARRRYDTRLLLAHLARLDLLAADEAAERAAGRFDELVAAVAGQAPPETLATEEDGLLPRDRLSCATVAAERAERAERYADDLRPPACDEAEEAQREAAMLAAGDAAYEAAQAEWDAWFARACAAVDAVAGETPGPEFKSLQPPGREGDDPAGVPEDSPDPVDSVNSVHIVNFANPADFPADAGRGLTFGPGSANGPPRPAGLPMGHPSETVGAGSGLISSLDGEKRISRSSLPAECGAFCATAQAPSPSTDSPASPRWRGHT